MSLKNVKDVKRTGKLHKQCKLCSLVEVDPGLWEEVHRKVMEEGVPRARVCKWLNSKIEIINVDLEKKIRPFSDENFSRHFHNHIPEYQKIKIMLRDKVMGVERDNSSGFSEESVAVVETYLEEHIDEYTDYTSITKMISTLESHLVLYNQYLIKKSADNAKQPGKRPIVLSELNEYKGLVESLTDLKLKLAKIRNSSVVSGAAVRRAVTLCVEVFLNQLMLATEESMLTLQDNMPASSLPEEVINKSRTRMADTIKAALPEIIEKIHKEFGIK